MVLTFLIRHLQEHFLELALYGTQLGHLDASAHQFPVDPPGSRGIRVQPERTVQYLDALCAEQLLDVLAGAVQRFCTYQERFFATKFLDRALRDQTSAGDDAHAVADLLYLA